MTTTTRLLLLAFLSSAQTAYARASSDVPYPVADVYSAAMRFVRIDKGCKVMDRDPDAAFVTFECKDEDKTKQGSLEIFRTTVGGRDGVRLQIVLGDDPHYIELRWIELLERKLKEERGTPPPISVPPAKKPPADGGT